MIRPSVFALTLVVIGLALLVASAGFGLIDRLPPQQYFPASFRQPAGLCVSQRWDGVKVDQSTVSDLEAEWYSVFWRTAQEPSLYLASQQAPTQGQQTYRFTWLRSFHEPMVVRLDLLPSGDMQLSARRLSGRGGYGAGPIAGRVDRILTPAEADRIERVLLQSDVLKLPPIGCEIGPDGAVWIIEANDRGTYRYVNRWSPQSGSLREAGLEMLKLTGWSLEPVG
jgi:hypothetical protein